MGKQILVLNVNTAHDPFLNRQKLSWYQTDRATIPLYTVYGIERRFTAQIWNALFHTTLHYLGGKPLAEARKKFEEAKEVSTTDL